MTSSSSSSVRSTDTATTPHRRSPPHRCSSPTVPTSTGSCPERRPSTQSAAGAVIVSARLGTCGPSSSKRHRRPAPRSSDSSVLAHWRRRSPGDRPSAMSRSQTMSCAGSVTDCSTLRKYILARLQAERNQETQVRLDIRRLDAFIDAVMPVEDLTVSPGSMGARSRWGSPRCLRGHLGGRPVMAAVRWGETGWPPGPPGRRSPRHGVDGRLPGHDVRAVPGPRDSQRRCGPSSPVRLAGASTDFADVLSRRSMRSRGRSPRGRKRRRPEAPIRTTSPWFRRNARDGRTGVIPLWRPEQLVVEGTPELIEGEVPGVGATVDRDDKDAAGPSAWLKDEWTWLRWWPRTSPHSIALA